MTYVKNNFIVRLLHAVQRRFVRARSGSVLILVVALLVILALIGTAWMAAARNDRYSATQNTTNTEANLLIEGMVELAKSVLTKDLISGTGGAGSGRYRPASDSATTYDYKHTDADGDDLFMAQRIPLPFDMNAPVAAGNPPAWYSVSWPLIENAGAGAYQFDVPDNGGSLALPTVPAPYGRKATYRFVPTSAAFAGIADFPHLQVFRDTGSGTPTLVDTIPAADADGDGIADAGLWKLLPGPIDGVTYYAGFRIIDNSAAFNVNTAGSRDSDFDGTGSTLLVGTFFPFRVGLLERLFTYNPGGTTWLNLSSEFAELNRYRLNHTLPEPVGVAGAPSPGPFGDDGAARAMDFISAGDALYMQLARRIRNPGFNTATSSYQAFDRNDMSAIAYRFCLVNPDAYRITEIENRFSESVTGDTVANPPALRDYPYDAGDVLLWFDEHFDYDKEDTLPSDPINPNTFRPLRSLLVTENQVAPQVPSHAADVNTDNVYEELPTGIPAPLTGTTGMSGYSIADGIPKTSLNQASFGELWRAFYNVMCDTPGSSPINEAAALLRLDPYYGTAFNAASPYAAVNQLNEGLMFRTSIRDVRNSGAATSLVSFHPFQQMLLRAALAAVNTIDLRDGDDDVTSRRITLTVTNDNVPTPTEIVVYGTERQPYITEVYVNTNVDTQGTLQNPKGYVAIELYNPYSSSIVLAPPIGAGAATDGWSLGIIDRRHPSSATPAQSPAKPALQLQNLDPTVGAAPFRFPPGTTIPAHGHIVLENYDTTNAVANVDKAQYRPPGAQNVSFPVTDATPNAQSIFVPYLHRVINEPTVAPTASGGELVLLRTRASSAVSQTVAGEYDEATNLHDMIPVDSFDFTGVTASTAAPYTMLHYVRENGTGHEWRHVYPGRYDGNALTQRHQGTQQESYTPPTPGDPTEPLPQTPINIGADDSSASYPSANVFTIQIANEDFGGPNKGAMAYPFGAFARVGDVLQVPFIGAYCVRHPSAGAGVFLEMNSVSMDSVFAEDTDDTDDPKPGDTGVQEREQIGRFYPISYNTGDPSIVDDFYQPIAPATAGYPGPTAWTRDYRYRWARDVFEFFSVNAPDSDYLPNVPGASGPDAVDNNGGTPYAANENAEKRVADQGRVNLNTASWKLLASLPLVTNSSGAVLIPETEALAKAIVYWRDVDADSTTAGQQPHGPFRDLFELNNLFDLRPGFNPAFGFRNGMNTLSFAGGTDPDDAMGDYSPQGPGGDSVRGDWEERTLVLNRISNLVTTRSDSFTCYIVLQGWRNAETANPQRVVERRTGYIIDRSGIVSTNEEVDAAPFHQ